MDRGGFLTAKSRELLDQFPSHVEPEDLQHFTLTSQEIEMLISARRRRPSRLAGGVQLGCPKYLGFVPDLGTVTSEIVELVAAQFNFDPDELGDYSTRDQTRSRHVSEIAVFLGFGRADQGQLKALGDWLVERSLEHDSPTVLFGLACERLKSQRVIRPGITVLERLVVECRQRATDETYLRISPQLTEQRKADLDALLKVDSELGTTPLVWLRRDATSGSAPMIKDQIRKIHQLRELGAAQFDLEALNPNRVRQLAMLGSCLNPQALALLQPARRYQILVACIVDGLVKRTDEVLDLFDLAMVNVESTARTEQRNLNERQQNSAAETVRLFNKVVQIIKDSSVPDSSVRAVILDQIGHERFDKAIEIASKIERPVDGGFIDLFRERYRRVRQFAPDVIAAFEFHSSDPNDPLIEATRVLYELNKAAARRVPPDAPTGFLTGKWRPYFHNSAKRIDRRTWELALLTELRGSLRGSNIWVDHSRRYQNPTNYLMPAKDWQRLKPETPAATKVNLDPLEQIEKLNQELNISVQQLDHTLTEGGIARVDNGELVVTPLDADDEDPDLEHLRNRIKNLLPKVDLVDLLVEVDSWCGFLKQLTHVDNSTSRAPDHTPRLLATVVAHGCNIGIDKMSRASGFSPDQLAWTNNLYLRTETVRAANNKIVNYQTGLPLTNTWGNGTLSSSDGQRFPITGKNPRARRNPKYFTNTGATIYTWTSDKHAQYGTRVIPTTVREATYVLDAIFDNETDLQIEEHTTDTAGYTDLIFGLFDLTGLKFSPRIRDINSQRLWRLPTTPTSTPAGKLLKHQINPNRITERWDDMLRVAATIRHGHLPASHLVARLQGSARQNKLTQAIQEYGRIHKTISTLHYLNNHKHRKRVQDQLNKGESIHALRREIHFANLGQLRQRQTDDQDMQGECLTLITNAILTWNTAYMSEAIRHIKTTESTPEAHLARLAPTSHEHVNFYGKYNFQSPKTPPKGQLRKLHHN